LTENIFFKNRQGQRKVVQQIKLKAKEMSNDFKKNLEILEHFKGRLINLSFSNTIDKLFNSII